MFKKYPTRLAAAACTALLALTVSAGSASASPDAGYIGNRYTTSGTPVW
ncbi:hypothetical protein [Streptomyces sp. 2131.1]|nr:hypothetical protein [Streptomyces sp. 2131.1]